jgi:hypothetical protein
VTDLLEEVKAEMGRACAKHGPQTTIPDGTGANLTTLDGACTIEAAATLRRRRANAARERTDVATREGKLTWRHVLEEEVCEAFAEDEPAKLRAELLQVAAVALRWIEAIDARATPPALNTATENA